MIRNTKNKARVGLLSGLIISLIAGLCYISISCDSETTQKYFTEDPGNDQSKRIEDSIFSVLGDYYNDYPDTAIIVALELEREFQTDGKYQELVRLYSFLSEIYQYRRDEPYKALAYLTKALDVISQNPDREFEIKYLYINAGNIMVRYGLYDEAINTYRQIPKLTDLESDPNVMALICNNIGLSFQKMGDVDSARYYFDSALPYIDKIEKRRTLFLIQYNNYLCSLAEQTGEIDKIPDLYNEILRLYHSIDYVLKEYPGKHADKYRYDVQLDYLNNKIMAWNWMGKYYLAENMSDSAIVMFSEALLYAKSNNDFLRCPGLYFGLAEANIYLKNYKDAVIHVDSAISYLKFNKAEISNLQEAYKKKSDILLLDGNNKEANIAFNLAEIYADSIRKLNASEELTVMKIELAVQPVQLAMKNIEISQNEKIRTIEDQKVIIRFLFVVLVLIAIAFYIYVRMYLKLKKTRVQLARTTIEKMKPEKTGERYSNRLSDTVEHELLLKFEKEVVNNKAYVEPNISLQLIADRLGTNRSYISRIINSVYKMNFNDYINKLRIDEACEIICNNKDPKFTIDHLYSEVGFVGKSTFYTAFKKYTGVTPAVFFKMNNQA